MTLKTEKRRAQVKSRFYYLFWGAATVSVLFGQLYVGSGYRQFAGALNRLFDTIEVQVNNPCLLYTSPSPRDLSTSRMPSSA